MFRRQRNWRKSGGRVEDCPEVPSERSNHHESRTQPGTQTLPSSLNATAGREHEGNESVVVGALRTAPQEELPVNGGNECRREGRANESHVVQERPRYLPRHRIDARQLRDALFVNEQRDRLRRSVGNEARANTPPFQTLCDHAFTLAATVAATCAASTQRSRSRSVCASDTNIIS